MAIKDVRGPWTSFIPYSTSTLIVSDLKFTVSNAVFVSCKKLCCRKEAARCFVSVLCIASIQNVERNLLLLVVSASDIPLRTIKFFSVLFPSAYSSMLQAVTNKHSLVSRVLCDLHCMVVDLSLHSSHVQQSSVASY